MLLVYRLFPLLFGGRRGRRRSGLGFILVFVVGINAAGKHGLKPRQDTLGLFPHQRLVPAILLRKLPHRGRGRMLWFRHFGRL